MFAKLAAARQLGVAKLIRRVFWRWKMLIRVFVFKLRHSKLRIADSDTHCAPSLTPEYSFLPPVERIRALLAKNVLRSDEQDRIRRHTDLILKDTIEVRGIGRVALQWQPGNWYKQTGASGPLSAAESVMINRHDFLLPLVQSFLMSKSPELPAKVRSMFTYWIDNFSTSRLLRHDTPIDAAIRLINWLWVFHFDLLELPPRYRIKLQEIIRIQLQYVSAWRSLGGNHLVLEALSNYLIYNAFSYLPDSARGKKWSRETLIDELRRQTTSDGIHTEQSFFYHQAVATHYLKFILMADATNDLLPAWVRDRFARMLDYVHDATKPDLTHPVIGDGEPMITDDREHWESKALLAARSNLFHKPICSEFLPVLNDSPVWILGLGPVDILTVDDLPPSRVFQESGAAIFRDDHRYLYFNAGQFGHPELPHHGHADALSIEFSMNDTNIFVDPGGYGYYDDEFRRFFRSTSAHNTVVIDDKNQSHLYGVFGYGRLANVSFDASDLNEQFDYASGSHDGYLPVRHSREIFFRKGSMPYLLIIDHLLGEGIHDGAVLYHLSPDATIDKSLKIRSHHGSTGLSTIAVSNTTLSQQIITGRGKPPYQGWVAPQTRVAVPADTLELRFKMSGNVFIAVVIATVDIIEQVKFTDSPMELVVTGDKSDRYKCTYSTRPITSPEFS